MRYAKLTIIVSSIAVLLATGCNRPQPADETVREDPAAADRQRQQDETARLEQRVAELEREWNEKEAAVTAETKEATAAMRAEIKEALADARRAIAEMRTTNVDNWWDRTERNLEQAAGEVEQDVKRFARRWTDPQPDTEVGTAGDDTTWDARRDRLVARLRARIDAMENALRDVDTGRARGDEVDDTRARMNQLRDDADRLDKADEDDWWDVTRDRVDNWLDRVEARINRLNPNQAG